MSSRMFKIAGSALILIFATVPSGTDNTDGRHSESDFSTNVQQADPDCPLNQFPHHCMKTKFPVGTYGGLWEGPDRLPIKLSCAAQATDSEGDPMRGQRVRSAAYMCFTHKGTGEVVRTHIGTRTRTTGRNTVAEWFFNISKRMGLFGGDFENVQDGKVWIETETWWLGGAVARQALVAYSAHSGNTGENSNTVVPFLRR